MQVVMKPLGEFTHTNTTQESTTSARCIWRMCGNERVICSLPRCVNQWQCERPKHKIGPGGCWTYQRPLKRPRRKLPQEGAPHD